MTKKKKTTCRSCPYSRTCHSRGACYSENPCDFALAFDRKDLKIQKLQMELKTLESMTLALELINAFVFAEYGDRPYRMDEAKSKPLGLAYTTIEDPRREIPLQVDVDLRKPAIIRYIDDVLIERIEYPTLRDLVVGELMLLNFDALVLYDDEDLEYARKFKEENRILEIIDKLLCYCKLSGYRLFFNKSGSLIFRDADGSFKDKDLYRFITEEMLCFEDDGTLSDGMYVPGEILEPYIQLSIAHGVVPDKPGK